MTIKPLNISYGGQAIVARSVGGRVRAGASRGRNEIWPAALYPRREKRSGEGNFGASLKPRQSRRRLELPGTGGSFLQIAIVRQQTWIRRWVVWWMSAKALDNKRGIGATSELKTPGRGTENGRAI